MPTDTKTPVQRTYASDELDAYITTQLNTACALVFATHD